METSIHEKINIRSWIGSHNQRNKYPYKKMDESWRKEAENPFTLNRFCVKMKFTKEEKFNIKK